MRALSLNAATIRPGTKRRGFQVFISILIVGAAALAAGCGGSPAPSVTNPTAPSPDAPTVAVPFTPNAPSDTLPTLLPTVLIPPTEPPSSPTLILVTATPAPETSTPRPVTLAPTRPRATSTTAVVATPTLLPEGMPKVFVTALRVEPATPKADQGGTFFVTFQNVSGQNQGYNWAVEIWDVDNTKHPFGLTTPQNSTLPSGVSTQASTGWNVKGLGECHGYRARAVARDEDDNRTAFVKPDGTELWLDFNVCP